MRPSRSSKPTPAPRPARLARGLQRIESLGGHRRVIAWGTLLGLVTAIATVVGWLWLAAEPMLDQLLGSRPGPGRRRHAGHGRQRSPHGGARGREPPAPAGHRGPGTRPRHRRRCREARPRRAGCEASSRSSRPSAAPPRATVPEPRRSCARSPTTVPRPQREPPSRPRSSASRRRKPIRELGALALPSSTEKALAAYRRAAELDPGRRLDLDPPFPPGDAGRRPCQSRGRSPPRAGSRNGRWQRAGCHGRPTTSLAIAGWRKAGCPTPALRLPSCHGGCGQAGGIGPGQCGLAARPVGELGQARRRAAGAGRPCGGAGGLRGGLRHRRASGGVGPGQRGLAARPVGELRASSATCGWRRATLPGRSRPTRPAMRSPSVWRRGSGQCRVAARPVGQL